MSALDQVLRDAGDDEEMRVMAAEVRKQPHAVSTAHVLRLPRSARR